VAAVPASGTPSGTIEIEVPKGRVRIEGAADPNAVRLVLECLRG
jgi:hypothetical protein